MAQLSTTKKEKKMIRILTILLTLTAFVLPAIGQGKPPRGDSDIPVISSIDDSDGTFRIRSDGMGAYTNGSFNAESIIQGIGDWVLNTKTSTVRRVYVDFGDSSGGTAPFAASFVPGRFITQCYGASLRNLNAVSKPFQECALVFSVDYGGDTYRIAMNNTNKPLTDDIGFTCLANGTDNRCRSWAGEPVSFYGGERKAKAEVIRVGTNKKNPDVSLGFFYFNFRVAFERP